MKERLTLKGVLVCLAALVWMVLPRTARAIDITDTFSISGFVEYEFFANTDNTRKDKADGRNEIQFHTEWIYRPSDELKAFVAPEFRFDANNEERNRVFLDEAYIDWYTEHIDWRIGKHIVSWGRADTIRPTDVWKVRDFTDFFADEEEGLVSVQGRFFSGDFALTGIWAPYFQPNTLPFYDERNRFMLLPYMGIAGACAPAPGCISTLTSAGPYTIDYIELKDGLPEDSVKSSEAGAKMEYTWEGWDFSLSYAYLHDRIPTYVDGINPFIPGEEIIIADNPGTPTGDLAVFGLRPVHKRIHMIGTDGATTFDKLGVRWEAAYFITEDRKGYNPKIDDPYLQVTAGLDYTFTNLVEDQDLMILVQYATDTELPKKGVKNIREGVNLRHFFEQGILGVIEWKFSEYLKLSTRGFINVKNADHQIEPVLEWSPTDGLVLTLSGQIVGGTGGKDSFFTLFEKEDRVEGAARYSF